MGLKMKKILTCPSECVDHTQDNKDGNLVVCQGDWICKSEETKYIVVELLGAGSFGQVFRCVTDKGEEYAIKVVKSFNKYYQYEINEVRILKLIKEKKLTQYFVELHDAFIHKHHLCIVLECLGSNMYDVTKILKFHGLRYFFLKPFIKQVLEGLYLLHNQGIIHCDLKPENILIKDPFTFNVKIIDFGSSTSKALSSIFYIQSRFYRAPEVILGISYSYAIDIWSFGCIIYELFTGNPLFPGTDNKDQIIKIHEFFPNGLPHFMLELGENTHLYFEKENNYRFTPSHTPFTIKDMKKQIYAQHGSKSDHDLFISFLVDALNLSYLERAMPHTLLKHPFLQENYNAMPVSTFSRNGPDIDHTEMFFDDNIRKMSMHDVRAFEVREDFYKNVRKGSVFNPNYENRRNNK